METSILNVKLRDKKRNNQIREEIETRDTIETAGKLNIKYAGHMTIDQEVY